MQRPSLPRLLRRALVVALATTALGAAAQAPYPSRPIRMPLL